MSKRTQKPAIDSTGSAGHRRDTAGKLGILFCTHLRGELDKVLDKVQGWVVKVEMNDQLFKLLKQDHDDQLITKVVPEKGQKICKESEEKSA